MGNVEYAECYAELANAIVLQAFKDYRKALFKLVQERRNGNTGPAKRNWSDSSTRSGIGL